MVIPVISSAQLMGRSWTISSAITRDIVAIMVETRIDPYRTPKYVSVAIKMQYIMSLLNNKKVKTRP